MKKALKKLDNKGFTLVELIIVIAIIAVLAAVLAPQYIKYLENSRISVDENAVAEIQHNVEVAIAEETVYNALGTTGGTVTVTSGSIAATPDALKTALDSTISTAPTFKSNKHKAEAADTYSIVVAYDTAKQTYTVTGTWG